MKNCCIFYRSNDFIGDAIVECQKIRNPKSEWSHVGFVGPDGLHYESTVSLSIVKKKIKIFKKEIEVPTLRYIYGIKITKAEDRIFEALDDKHISKIGIQTEFNLPDEVWLKMTEYAYKNRNLQYGGFELFGTLYTLLKWKATSDPKKREEILKERNPFDSPKAVYCIAFVADAFAYAGVSYLPKGINSSISIVDDGWNTPIPHTKNYLKVSI